MTEYRVTWTLDLEAGSPLEAARLALEVQRDPASIATAFDVAEVYDLDLGANDDPECPRCKVWSDDCPLCRGRIC